MSCIFILSSSLVACRSHQKFDWDTGSSPSDSYEAPTTSETPAPDSATDPALDDPVEGTTTTNTIDTGYQNSACYTTAEVGCDNPNAFEDPGCFIKTLEQTIEEAKTETINYYVAPTQENYLAQGHIDCPWTKLDTDDDGEADDCPWGDDSNDGLSTEKPLATFKAAFDSMATHKAYGTKTGHYTLQIRGGKFSYDEPIVIAGYSTLGGTKYKGPHLYDEGGVVVKAADGVVYYSGDDGYEEATKNIVSDITVQPYNNETVTIDGTCSFTPPTGTDGQPIEPGHSEWDDDDTTMERTCTADRWGNPDLDTYTYGFFHTMGMVYISNAHRIEIKDLHIKNSPSFGIIVYGASKDIILEGNSITNTYSSGLAAMFHPSNIMARNNSISYACAGSNQENLSFKGNITDFAIVNNTVENGYNDAGIDIGSGYWRGYVGHNEIKNTHTASIYVSAQGTDSGQLWVNANHAHDSIYGDCIRFASESRGAQEDVIFSNNLCYNTLRGIWIAGYFHLIGDNASLDPTVVGVPMDRIYVLNNTVYNTGNEIKGYGLGFAMTNPGATNVVVRNNIFSQGYKNITQFKDVTNDDGSLNESIINFSNNITFCSDSDEKDDDGNLACLSDNGYELAVPNNIQEDPLFVDPENGDFHLQENSPAKNAGVSLDMIPEYDYDCDQRSYKTNTEIDIGADEFYE